MKTLADQIFDDVKGDLAAIETALEKNLKPHLVLVREVAGHALFSGGKRLRPLMMLLSARVCGYDGDFAVTLSTIFEYLHTATLMHDDVVDGASTRRGKPSAHSLYNGQTAILVGDFLLARTCSIATQSERLSIIKTIADVTGTMSEGELAQLSNRGNPNLTEDEYLAVIRRKTAALIEAACYTGALLAGAEDPKAEALAEYGKNCGMAFQMADDLLDYTSETAVSGKNPGADLNEGTVTLPLIHALTSVNGVQRKRAEEIIRRKSCSGADFAFILELIKEAGGVAYTRQKAAGHIASAKKALDAFPESKPKETLLLLADYMLTRKL